MGDIANMMIDGVLCETCGVYLGNETGYPRSCCDKDHYNYMGKKSKKQIKKILQSNQRGNNER